MKKIIAVMCCVLLTLLQGCADIKKVTESDKLSVVTTIFPIYDFAKNVVGDKGEVILLTSLGAQVHSYEPTAKDIIKISESDLFITIGGAADPWTEKVVNATGAEGNSLAAMDCIDDLLNEEHTHEHELSVDEHIWTSLENAKDITKAIAQKLSETDSENAAYYKKNAENYSKKLEKLDGEIADICENGKRRTLVFADIFPFRYFAHEYELLWLAAIPGCGGESEPAASDVAKVIETVKSEAIPYVFYTETSDGKIADTICDETGAQKLMMHSCHNVTKKEFDSGVTYLSLMEQNKEVLKKALE